MKDEERRDIPDAVTGLAMEHATGLPKHAIRTWSGRWLDFTNPKPDQFTMRDIAIGLSRECRFGRQGRTFYSVAQHLIACYDVAKTRFGTGDVPLLRAVAMHDAAEAFMGDMPRPLKLLIPQYKVIENQLMDVIAAKWGLDYGPAHKEIIEQIDLDVMIAERDQLFPNAKAELKWVGEERARPVVIHWYGWNSGTAESYFLEMVKYLGLDAVA